MNRQVAKFTIGQLIQHQLFEYRGVVIDIDPESLGSADWYKETAKSNPPKDRPWYHILVNGNDQHTYVAEQNIEHDREGDPIHHNDLNYYFRGFGKTGYILRNRIH